MAEGVGKMRVGDGGRRQARHQPYARTPPKAALPAHPRPNSTNGKVSSAWPYLYKIVETDREHTPTTEWSEVSLSLPADCAVRAAGGRRVQLSCRYTHSTAGTKYPSCAAIEAQLEPMLEKTGGVAVHSAGFGSSHDGFAKSQ
eukprot:scaffold1471_cov73-Phaeocystis_antarctica.AAC.1